MSLFHYEMLCTTTTNIFSSFSGRFGVQMNSQEIYETTCIFLITVALGRFWVSVVSALLMKPI